MSTSSSSSPTGHRVNSQSVQLSMRPDCRGCVSLIIPTFNSERYISDCIDSILAQEVVRTHVIVVDNNSSDKTREIVREAFPHAQLVSLNHNTGYAGGCNAGFAISHSDIVGFVNADCTLERSCVADLHALMMSNPRLGAIMPKICLKGDPSLINTDGNLLQYLGFAACGNLNKQSSQSQGVVTIPYPSGAMMLVRRSAFEEVGGFDSDFFMYHEDVDLGLRLRLVGHDIVCNRDAEAFHDYEPWRNKTKLFYYERNRLATMLKVYSRRTLAAFVVAFVLAELGVLAYSARRGWLKTKARSYLAFLTMVKTTLAKRSEIQSSRKVSDSEVFKHLTATFETPLIFSPRGPRIMATFLKSFNPALHEHYPNTR